jgi:predicted metal-dependent hydrolase
MPRPLRRPAGRPSQATRRPVQLELFQGGDAKDSRPAPPRSFTRPVPVPSPRDPEAELCRRLNRLVRGRVRSVIFTENRRTILSVKPGKPGDFSQLVLRIHRCFQDCPDDALQAVAGFLESKKGSDRAREALAVIREHFGHHRGETRPAPRRVSLRSEGLALDLRQVADDLNERYFDRGLKFEITWGKGPGEAHRCQRARTASLQLGSYSYEDRLIRIHRVLDQPGIPRYVIEAVVFHEMVHAALPPVVRNGRRYFHTPEFRRREREYRHLQKADQWIQEHLPELLRARQGNAARRPRSRR